MNAAIETMVSNYPVDSDVEEQFGKLVATELRKKNPDQRGSIKLKIMEILYAP